jgi:hypothetical protein
VGTPRACYIYETKYNTFPESLRKFRRRSVCPTPRMGRNLHTAIELAKHAGGHRRCPLTAHAQRDHPTLHPHKGEALAQGRGGEEKMRRYHSISSTASALLHAWAATCIQRSSLPNRGVGIDAVPQLHTHEGITPHCTRTRGRRATKQPLIFYCHYFLVTLRNVITFWGHFALTTFQ